MLKKLTKKRNQKGFTLVELVVVIAILGILAAIAVPRFTGMRHEATAKAEGATAASIISAARVQEAESGKAVTAGEMTNGSATSEPGDAGFIDAKFMTVPTDTTYTIGKSGDLYTVSWPTNAGGTTYTGKTLMLKEGTAFDPKPNHK